MQSYEIEKPAEFRTFVTMSTSYHMTQAERDEVVFLAAEHALAGVNYVI